jgi:dUTP pyrophosphatase
MQVNITRIDDTLPLPEYHTSGAAAFDLYARVETTVAAKSLGIIPSNLIIKTPPGYMLVVVPRSSTPRKFGLSIPHGIGIIDQDYAGANDEIGLQVYNFTDQTVTIARGERICQAAFVPIERAQWVEGSGVAPQSRGGFGSTD